MCDYNVMFIIRYFIIYYYLLFVFILCRFLTFTLVVAVADSVYVFSKKKYKSVAKTYVGFRLILAMCDAWDG